MRTLDPAVPLLTRSSSRQPAEATSRAPGPADSPCTPQEEWQTATNRELYFSHKLECVRFEHAER